MAAPKVFVSHSHKDDDFSLRLVKDLRRDLGNDDAVWYDVSGGLHGGDAWWRTIVREITLREFFIVVLSPDAVASKWVEDEIDLAWQQKNSYKGKTIIPILYRNCDVRADLETRHIISLPASQTYTALYAEVLAALGIPTVPDRQVSSLRTDGLYMTPTDRYWYCIRFYPEGRVASAIVAKTGESKKIAAQRIATWLAYEHKDATSGTYTVRGANIRFISAAQGSTGVKYSGVIQSEHLLVNTQNGQVSYTFVPARFGTWWR